MIKISFTIGGGGNWLQSMINFEELDPNPVNFHQHKKNKNYNFEMSVGTEDSLDPTKFDYLFSGKAYFNFYINQLYKEYHHEFDYFNQNDYKTCFLKCVDTARFICRFDKIYDHTFFNFDDLINFPNKFYNKLIEFQTVNKFDQTTFEDFSTRREKYISTCPIITELYENFDNMIWVCFILGQLLHLGIYPTDFFMYEQENQQKCIKFAKDHYNKCLLNNAHHFNSSICLPKWL